MADGIKLLQWRQMIDAREYEAMKRFGGVDRFSGRQAADALAEMILRDAAVQRRQEVTDPDSPWGADRLVISWAVGIADRSVAGSLKRQLDQARAAGMRDAAALARDGAARAAEQSGMCAGVIASAMDGLARKIEALAERAEREASQVTTDEQTQATRAASEHN